MRCFYHGQNRPGMNTALFVWRHRRSTRLFCFTRFSIRYSPLADLTAELCVPFTVAGVMRKMRGADQSRKPTLCCLYSSPPLPRVFPGALNLCFITAVSLLLVETSSARFVIYHLFRVANNLWPPPHQPLSPPLGRPPTPGGAPRFAAVSVVVARVVEIQGLSLA